MKAFRSSASRWATFLLSIAGLMFVLGRGAYAVGEHPSAPTNLTEHVLRLKNNWHSADPGNGTGQPRYAVSQGVVHLSGSLTQPSGTNTMFAILPPGARPGHVLYLPIYVSEGAPGGVLQIFPNGVMAVFSTNPRSARDFSSLAGVSFPLGS